MERKSNTERMLDFVREYLDGDMPRMFFDLDFYHFFNKYYPAMERQNPEMAGCFAYYLSEEGVDVSEGLADSEHKKLLRRQFKKFTDARGDGMW